MFGWFCDSTYNLVRQVSYTLVVVVVRNRDHCDLNKLRSFAVGRSFPVLPGVLD